MRIGLVRRGYSPTGGAETYLARLLGELLVAGHECTLFGSPGWPVERLSGAALVPVPARGPRAFADALAALDPRSRCDALFSLERVWECDCYRAGDGVHRAWLERRARAEPAWRGLLRRWNPKHRQILALEESLLGQGGARAIIANSQLVRREIIEHYGCPPSRITVIYNGLPASAFRPPEPGLRARTRAAIGIGEGDFVVLFAGTGWERKGLRYVLAAVGRLPGTLHPRLLVAGRGNPRSAGRASERARFLGPVQDMPAYYAAADVFVLPTLYDPFSNACLEALAAGLPVITTSANGFSEILSPGEDGEVIDPVEDPATALTEALLAWSDSGRRMEARARCAAKAATFTIESNVAQTVKEMTNDE